MLNILFEDNHIIVVKKPVNIPVQADETGDADLLTLVKNYIKVKYNKPGAVYCGLVHRLDRPVGGVMVFARTSKAASRLSAQFAGGAKKRYAAVTVGRQPRPHMRLEDFLLRDGDSRTSSVVSADTPGAKRACLDAYAVASTGGKSLLDIALHTGRHHQIRVQLAHAGMPIWGDQRYNPQARAGQQIALFAYSLTFEHPTLRQSMTFTLAPSGGAWDTFGVQLSALRVGLRAVYADENIIVINKPAGITCAIADGGDDTVEGRLAAAMGEVYPVHRLDSATSGLVMFARNRAAYASLSNAVRTRTVTKRYICICRGRPQPACGRLRLFADKNSAQSFVRVYDRQLPGAAEMITDYRTLDTAGGASLVEVTLVTGRTHQIRASLAHIGCPVAGDDKYGDRDFNRSRRGGLALFAAELAFAFPTSDPLEYLNAASIQAEPDFSL